jgi:hypothetical protein
LNLFKHLLIEENLPILAVFSKAGALVHNRYGFFWNLQFLELDESQLLILFEDQEVLTYNIASLLEKAQISYEVLPIDSTFSRGIWLANQRICCIIGSPLTSNSAAKIVTGITDTLITNIISAGKKAKQQIGILPTDQISDIMVSKLPVRQKKPLSQNLIAPQTCSFSALTVGKSSHVEFRPEYCVGCQKCVQVYPEHFSLGEEIKVHIRKIDSLNTQKLSEEFRTFNSPREILPFITSGE